MFEIKPKIHNRFDFVLTDQNGQERQVAYAENIVLDQAFARLCAGQSYFTHIHYGTGSGIPNPTRTSLFNFAGALSAVDVAKVYDMPTSHWRRSITLDTLTGNGLEISEIGCAHNSTSATLTTHAMVRDMNGNLTTIVKTGLDILTIYATVYITLDNTDPAIKLVRPDQNLLVAYLMGGTFPSANFSLGTIGDVVAYPNRLMGAPLGVTPNGSWTNDVANKKRTTSVCRVDEVTANGNAREIGFSGIARMPIPSSVAPGLELSGVPLGVGDGLQKIFNLPSANINLSTLAVKIDGVLASGYTQVLKRYATFVDDLLASDFPSNGTSGLAISPDGLELVVGRSTSIITGSEVLFFRLINGTWHKKQAFSYARGVTDVSISRDGLLCAISSTASPNLVLLRKVGGVWEQAPDPAGTVIANGATAVAFSPLEDLLVVGTNSGLVGYKLVSGVWQRQADMFAGFTRAPINIRFAADGLTLAVSHSSAGGLTIFEKADGVWASSTIQHVSGTASGSGLDVFEAWVAVGLNNSTVAIYRKIDGVWTSVEVVTTTRNALAVGLLSSTTFVAGYSLSPYLEIYDKSGGGWAVVASEKGTKTLRESDGCALRIGANDILVGVTYALAKPVEHVRINYANTAIEFNTAPAVGEVITADYAVNGIHKTDQRVIDLTGEVVFG